MARASGLPFPPQLNLRGNLAVSWKRFKRVWENYEIAAGLDTKENPLRVATLLTCLGPDAIELFDGFTFAEDADKEDPDKIIEQFENYCVGETNEMYERYKFNTTVQELGESIDTYLSSLRTLAKICNYDALEDSLIRDRMVIGIRDESTRKKLLQQSKLTLKVCVDICRANEQTEQRIKAMKQEEVSVVRKQNKRVNKSNSTGKVVRFGECKFCGREHKQIKEECPAWGKRCLKCGGENHFKAKCRAKQQNQTTKQPKQVNQRKIHTVRECSQVDSDDEQYVVSVETVNGVEDYPSKLHAEMMLSDYRVDFQLDSGSTVNIISEDDYKAIYGDYKVKHLQKSTSKLVMYNKTEIRSLGKRKLKIINPINDKSYYLKFFVVEGKSKPLLGAAALQEMELIFVNREFVQGIEDKNTVTKDEECAQGNDLLEEYQDIFNGEGLLKGELHLVVDKSVTPVKLPVRKMPLSVKLKVKAEIQRLAKLGIITPVNTPTNWISSMVVVLKSNDKVRLCIDPKPLNKALNRNNHPIPTIEDVLPELSKARVFTVADAKNGFWQVKLDEESSYLTTFGTPWGKYRWERLPFGVSLAPEEFQRRMNEVVDGPDGVKAVHDDALIFGCGDNDAEAIEDHDRKLKLFFERCRQANLKLNKDKLRLRKTQVSFLGHVISKEGLHVDKTKATAIENMPTPTDKKSVQRLLGMVNFVQRFSPKLSEITEPLRQLTRKETEFCWNAEHERSFYEVKKLLSSSPVLRYFDEAKQTVLQCDASKSGLGVCLLQEGHPVAYASRALTAAEKNYAQIEKELLSIVFGMEKFETYVYGRNVKVETDHKPLEIICQKSLATAPKRLQRMLLALQKYDFDVVYIPGKQMHMADALSRAYLPYKQAMKGSKHIVFAIDVRSPAEKETEEINALRTVNVSSRSINEIEKETQKDPVLSQIKTLICKG